MTEEKTEPQDEPFIAADRFLADLGGVALFGMMMLTVISIMGRFLFSMPIPDVEAIAEMMLVGVVFLGLAFTQAKREHVEVTLFTNNVSHRAQARFEWFGRFLGVIAFSVLAYSLAIGAERAWSSGDAYLGVNQIVTWPARLIAVIGLLALILRLLLDLTIARRSAQEDGENPAKQNRNYE